jgi:Asp-tRNA(Asn)/Glu-tRNA(Gln) amidotransferase A subunit family amidase
MLDLDLCYLPATKALHLFKHQKLSPVELVKAVIARAEATEMKVNAFTFTYFDEALALARKAEEKYMRGRRTGPLEGLPIAIKDESYIRGKPTSMASLIFKDRIAEFTSPVNERILRSGGIVHARSATPEFSCAPYTWSKLWGVTRNPWNLRYTPGGSSGGSGASLAAGTCSLATGSDIGGSIRIPASACGLVGYKPPFGRNPDDPPFNLDPYCHTGPLARCVADSILLQNVMAGPHPRDIVSLRPKYTLPASFRPVKGRKIALSMDLGAFDVDGEVAANTRNASDVFRSLGYVVEEVDIGWDKDILKAGIIHLEHIFATSLSTHLMKHSRAMTTYARQFARHGIKSAAADFLWAIEKAAAMYQTLGPLLEKYDLLLCPTTALPAVAADFDHTKEAIKINGRKIDPFLGWVMTTPFNMMSRCPVLSLPSGRARNGVPTGIQIVGRTYRDADVFGAAAAYEIAAGPWFMSKETRPNI